MPFDQAQYLHLYNDESIHNSVVINNNKNIIKLKESRYDGNIRIWNFHSGNLINKIFISQYQLNGICLWDNNYLFVGCKDKTIKMVEIKNGLIVKNLIGHNNIVLTVKKIFHPKYGECLISQNYAESEIKLWINDI